MEKEQYLKAGQDLRNDIEMLERQNIREITHAVGAPKCATLASRMKKHLDILLDEYDLLTAEQNEAVEREQFDLLSGLLVALANEIAILVKKQPDGLVNAFKVGQINRVLNPLKDIMKDEPSTVFLDVLAEVESGSKTDKSRNTYSDAALILSQYREACGEYRAKYYDKSWHVHL